MICDPIRLPGGGIGFVCSRGPRRRTPRCRCGKPGTRQCDFPIGGGKTCDKFLCASCAVRQGRNVDFCPDHPGQDDLLKNVDTSPAPVEPVDRSELAACFADHPLHALAAKLPPRPDWLRLGAKVEIDGKTYSIAGIQPTTDGTSWEILPVQPLAAGGLGAGWIPIDQVKPVAPPNPGYKPWPHGLVDATL